MSKPSVYKSYFKVTDAQVFGFFEDFRFLSNFHKIPFFYNGILYSSTEHAYQMAKHPNLDELTTGELSYLATCSTPSEIRKWGQSCPVVGNWDDIKYAVMLDINLIKFAGDKNLKKNLLATEDKELVEANHWGDKYWGFSVQCKEGENNLGKILMTVRDTLKSCTC